MCGIFGYIGKKNPLETCLRGLEHLEYRGYDSTGIAGIIQGRIAFCKKEGKLSNLKKELKAEAYDLAIGHTRWATHGRVNDLNAHPHFNEDQSIAIVHNGIIENYDALKETLKKQGVVFSTETDTEVVVQLIAKNYSGDLLSAVQKTLPLLRGSYAFAVIHKSHPDQIIAAACECPLAIGVDEAKTEAIISSDPGAFIGDWFNVLYLRYNEVAKVEKGSVQVFDAEARPIAKKIERFASTHKTPSKEGYDHFFIKEIHQQPATVQKTLDSIQIPPEDYKKYKQILLIGCGTSANAGAIGAAYLEELAGIPSHAEIASEARFRTALIGPETLVIAISQSGETADTIACARAFKERGCRILGICNVKNSTLTRESDANIYLEAGPEVSVCSSKAFTSQVAVLALFALHISKRGARHASFQTEFHKIPSHIQHVLDRAHLLEEIAQKYARYDDFFFMGRRYMYTTCLEAALKLKEISYVNANGYPGGELKHGPIALICPTFPVIAFCANHQTEDKISSNLMEVKARGAPILAFAPEGMHGIEQIADDLFWLPDTIDPLAPFASIVAGQLFAYYVAKLRGCDIDQPRNLAKSVTVE